MGIRYRRSIKLGGGVRLNFSKGGIGVSAGVPGLRYSVNTSGRRTRTVGIPGTGVSHVTSLGGVGGGRTTAAPPAQSVSVEGIPKPGIFASQAERRFHAGLVAYLQRDWSTAYAALADATVRDERNVTDDLLAALAANNLGDGTAAIRHMERVVAGDIALPDKLMNKYLPADRMAVSVPVALTERVKAVVNLDSLGATLILSEMYQEAGRREEAIGLIQQLYDQDPTDAALRLSLADLLYDDADYDGVLELTSGITNDDDLTLATMHLGAKALADKGLMTAAVEQLTACLRRTANRDDDLLTEIRYDRAEAYGQLGKVRQARADYERVYARDASFRDVAAKLAALQAP